MSAAEVIREQPLLALESPWIEVRDGHATDEQRVELLRQMADMQDRRDARCRYARWRLGIREDA